MNGGVFGRIPFARIQSGRVRNRSIDFGTLVNASVGVASRSSREAFFMSDLDGKAGVVNVRQRAMGFGVALEATATLRLVAIRESTIAASLLSRASLAFRHIRDTQYADSLNAKGLLNSHAFREALMESELAHAVELTAKHQRQWDATGSLLAFVEAGSYLTETMDFDLTMPPGSRLVIDTENYTAYLDNENVIHLHDGDWIRLDRSMVEFIVASGITGDLSGTVVFKEWYL